MPRVYKTGHQPDGTFKLNLDWMELALADAQESLLYGDHPVGALVIGPRLSRGVSFDEETILGRSNNRVHRHNDPTAHAETLAIREAVANGTEDELRRSALVTTHICCPQCAGSMWNARLAGVCYSTSVEDVNLLLSIRKGFKWRSNEVPMEAILYGEIPVSYRQPYRPFIQGGILHEQGIAVLERVPELETFQEHFNNATH